MNHSSSLRRLRSRLPGLAALCAALAFMLGTAAPTHAAGGPSATTASPTAAKKKTSKALRIKNSQNHSGETTAERDRRLYRECKGLPNAGACRGYTQR